MLPTHTAKLRIAPDSASARRYVDYVIREVADAFHNFGAARHEVEVKLFGGADVLASSRASATVGRLNVETALRVLDDEGFHVLSSRLGGNRGIFIEFHTETGEVLLRKLAGMDSPIWTRT